MNGYALLLRSSDFSCFLLHLDEDQARAARSRGCSCGGPLHQANYRRKPRGGPRDLPDECTVRLSLCCAVEGCRKRTTPPSLRFLARRVYFAAIVVLVSALRDGTTVRRAAQLKRLLGVDLRTLRRWREWWRSMFPVSSFWALARGRLIPAVEPCDLPHVLLDRFIGPTARERLVQILNFLTPISTTSKVPPVL